MSLQMSKYDIVIVGGGLSGLVSAMTLVEHEPDINIALLEANNRLGGRIFTVTGQVSFARRLRFTSAPPPRV